MLDQIGVQESDFDVAKEYEALRQRCPKSGAIVLFTGLVRDFNDSGSIQGLELEHYPAMTEKSLAAIVDRARERWPIEAVTLIHRVGKLLNTEQIVLVAVASQHRAAAFSSAEFIMDFLKTEAPFWKKEQVSDSECRWVEAKLSDQKARESWNKN